MVSRRVSAQDVRAMIEAMARAVEDAEPRLTRLDSAIGDGDHGASVRRGFQAAREALAQDESLSIADVFRSAGTAMMRSMGGASGPIFGGLFTGAARAAKGKESLSAADFAQMWKSGLDTVMKRGGAAPGDKTMLDALAPAVEAALNSAEAGQAIEAVAAAAAVAAEAGAKATGEMMAKRGRARFLGDRSKGHMDAGAVTVEIIFRATAESLKRWEDANGDDAQVLQ